MTERGNILETKILWEMCGNFNESIDFESHNEHKHPISNHKFHRAKPATSFFLFIIYLNGLKKKLEREKIN